MCKQNPKCELWSWDSHSGEQYCFSWHRVHLVTFLRGGDNDSGSRQNEQKRGGWSKDRECETLISSTPEGRIVSNSRVYNISRTDARLWCWQWSKKSCNERRAPCNCLSVTSVSLAINCWELSLYRRKSETTGSYESTPSTSVLYEYAHMYDIQSHI